MADMELIRLCTLDVTMGEQHFVGEGPAGLRVVVEASAATMGGDRVSGHMKGPMADWLVVNGTVGSVDARGTIETDDGALIHMTYGGRMDLTEGPGAAPVYIAPVFETSDERYTWLNIIQAVGKGTLEGDALHYDIYEVS